MATCRGCGREIIWAKGEDGDYMALDATIAIDGVRYTLDYEEGVEKPKATPTHRFGFQGHREHECGRPYPA